MKRIVCICFLVMFSICLTACNSASITCKNGHGIDKEWHKDSASHYVVCDKCGDVVKHEHDFDWKVTSEANGTMSEIKSEYCSDCGYLTGRVDSLDTWNGKTITKSDVLRNKILTSHYADSKGRKFSSILVNRASDLIAIFNELDDHKNLEITLTGDIDVTAGNWVSGIISGIDCGDVEIIINGNYHKIIGLNNPLIEKITTGNTKVIIRNLIIENANINVNDNAGVFIASAKGANSIVIDGCEINNSKVVGKNCIGGFVGVAGGNSFVYDKVFTNLEIRNSSIVNSSIGGDGFVGAVIGKASSDAWTKTLIEDTSIINNRITSTSVFDDYAGFVVGVAGVAGAPKTVSGTIYQGGVYLVNIVESENVASSYLTDVDRLYGCLGESTAKLYIDGICQF